jgi:splicing factor 3B subunit 3
MHFRKKNFSLKMHLYNLTLKGSTQTIDLIAGNFSSKNQVLFIRNGSIAIMDQLKMVSTQLLFGLIRQVKVLRVPGSSVDLIVLTSDSGRFMILQWNGKELVRVAQQTFGKSGIRRGVVGEYLAVDPMGRAILVGAVERVKFGYTVTSRDGKVELSSPIVSNKNVVCQSLVGLDVGYENPMFASLEQELEQDSKKKLVLYELDLGLNHLVRKWEKVVDVSSHLLIPVPQMGGVLVCQEGMIEYLYDGCEEVVKIGIPKRVGSEPTLIVAFTTHATKKTWFILFQTEDGDLFKLTMDRKEGEGIGVGSVKVMYFDSVPRCRTMSILKTGYLLCASECGDVFVYQVESLGKEDTDIIVGVDENIIEFVPKELEHISLVDKIQSLAPLVDSCVIQGETPSIITLSGMGTQSTLRCLKHGLGVEELGSSELPATPTGVWSVDEFLVLGFVNATLVLKVDESVEEVEGTGLVTSMKTLSVGRIGDGIVQVYEKGVRFIKGELISEWNSPTKVLCGTVQDRVVVVTKEKVVVFEYVDGGVVETGSIDLQGVEKVSCAGVFCALVVGTSVRMLDMKRMEMVGMQVLSDDASGVVMCEENGVLFLHIGLVNGVYVRTTVDRVTGSLGDVRQRFLGREVQVRKVFVTGKSVVMAMSNQTWISSDKRMIPLAYEPLDMACGLEVGVVGVIGNELRILGVEMDGLFYQTEMTLKYTPRRILEYKQKVIVLEAEYGVQGQDTSDHNGFVEREGVVKKQEHWGSCIRYVDPTNMETLSLFELEENEAAVRYFKITSMSTCVFLNHSYEEVLVVGTVTGMKIRPKSFQKGSLRVYRFGKRKLELLHVTEVDGIPLALCPFQGKILVGMGTVLRIYDIGKKKLLRKCESRVPLFYIGFSTKYCYTS